MCPEKNHTNLNRQRGFLMPVALFIIVIMGVYVLVLWRTTSQSNIGAVQEVISVQAFYAAESGAQHGMAELFFPEVSRRQTDLACENMNNTLPFSVTGLDNCLATVTCTCVYENASGCTPNNTANYGPAAPVAHSFYTLTSTGSCTVGNINAQRTLEVQAAMKEQGI